MGEFRRLYYQTKEKGSFKTFKWLLKGRWNQGTGNSGDTRTYLQWDELGISYVGSDGVKYGPTYWTVDSFSSSGTPWADMRGPADLFDGEWGSETSKCDYYNINDTDGYVEIIIHTTSGDAIIPNGVGLISSNNQSNYASSTPGHFILYGLDERTNEYIQLIDVPAANVNKGNTQTTTVSFDSVEVVTGTYYLLAPSDISRGSGLRFDIPYDLVYLSYMTQLDGQNDVPLVNKIGSVWNFNSRRTGTSNVSISGAMPNTYSGQNYASFGGAGVTGILPVTTLRKFTICGWMRSDTSGAGEFWGVRYHTAFSQMIFYLADATNYLNFNFGLTTSNYTTYEMTSIGDNGGDCPTTIANKSNWAYVCLYIDRDENRAEYWVNNHHMFDISGKADLFNGNQNFDTILRFYPDADYSGFYLCELAIWSGQRKTDVPTEPLSNIYGS